MSSASKRGWGGWGGGETKNLMIYFNSSSSSALSQRQSNMLRCTTAYLKNTGSADANVHFTLSATRLTLYLMETDIELDVYPMAAVDSILRGLVYYNKEDK